MKRTAADARWSKAVRERANYTCQRCGTPHTPNSQGLHAAHIFSRGIKRTRCDESNGLALCYGCHRFVDGRPLEREALARLILGDGEFEALRERAHAPAKRVQIIDRAKQIAEEAT
jgi:hypothetical protein